MRRNATPAAEPKDEGRRWRAARYAALATALGASTGLVVGTAAPAHATAFVVTNLDDAGAGSLRAQIADANASPGADTITFSAGLSGTISLTTGTLAILEGLTITGPGSGQVTVDAGGLSRVLDIHADTPAAPDVIVTGLTLSDGKAPPDPSPVNPGDLDEGGAIHAVSVVSGALTLSDVAVTGSTGGDGAGLLVRGLEVAITNSSFSGNSSGGGGGAVRGFASDISITDSAVTGNTAALSGGGIRVSAGSLDLLRTTVDGNHAASAGGIRAAADAIVSVDSSTISDNTADGATGITGNGGGMVLDDLAVGSSTITRSLISGNTATANGGGADVGTGDISLTNVTVSGNTAGNEGGGLRFNGGSTTVTAATIAGNTAGTGGGALSTGPGATLRGSVLSDNSSTDPAEGDLTIRGLPTDGPVNLDYTLVEATPIAGTTADVTPGSNIIGDDPELGDLQDHGGATLTRLPAVGSPALDKGKSFGLTEDQRGRARPFDLVGAANAAGGDGSDLGAVELLLVENTAAPTMSGAARVGATMAATGLGSWTLPGVTLTRQWLRNGTAIPGATGPTYVVGAADLGKRISLRVDATKTDHTPGTATSAPSAVVVPGTLVTTGSPRILGRLKVRRTLTAVAPTAVPAATVRYQWLRNGKPVAGATKARYRLRKADARKRMSVKVTMVRSGYVTKVVVIRRSGTVRR